MSAPASAPEETALLVPSPSLPRSGGRPAWQRHPLFKFFSSVKLAVILLSVLIVASIVGTLYETSFDAKVARAYIYNAWWFDLWLTVLCVNLACAAFSRMPWKRHHTGFLVTHLGIIILLVGAMIGRGWGIEGTMTLHKGEAPDNQLLVDQRVLRVEEPGSETRQYPVEIIGRHPSPSRPWSLGQTAGGWDITLVDYAPLIDAAFEPQPGPPAMAAEAQPAVRVRLVTKRVGATLDNWLLAGDPEHGTLDLSGLASVRLLRGVAPVSTDNPAAAANGGAMPPAEPAVNEAFVALALSPSQTVDIPSPNSPPSGANVRLAVDAAGKKTVFVDWRGATWSFDPDTEQGKPQDLSGSGLNVVIEGYWPDFVMRDGKPTTASPEPRNPAVLVRLTGKLPAPAADDPALPPVATAPGAPPPMSAGTQASNQAAIYCDEHGGLTYTLKSRSAPTPVRGTLKPGESIPTGWMDWQLEAVQVIPAALSRTTFKPVREAKPASNDQSATSGDPNVVNGGGGGGPGPMSGGNRGEGVLVRLSHGGQTLEQWASVGWQVTLPTTPQPTRLAYDSLIQGLPIGLQLEKFDVTFNDGTEDPASFQSHLRVTDVEGREGTGSCSMNQPFNFPGHWWNTFSGLTFKMSQAQWNPNDLNQSTIQILRDPGWLFKWIGSLLICAGIFTMFYLRPAKVPVKPATLR